MDEEQTKKIEVRRIREEAVRRCSEAWRKRLDLYVWTSEEHELFDRIPVEVERDLMPYLYGKEY